MLLEWFENFRLRCEFAAGRDAANAFWRMEVPAGAGRSSGLLWGLAELFHAKARESDIPVNVGFFGEGGDLSESAFPSSH
jgi:hypothetical protein